MPVPPLAAPFRLSVFPEHIAPPFPIDVMAGDAFTDTLTVAVLLQPATLVPVTVYMVADEGPAVTLVPVVADNPVAGIHE